MSDFSLQCSHFSSSHTDMDTNMVFPGTSGGRLPFLSLSVGIPLQLILKYPTSLIFYHILRFLRKKAIKMPSTASLPSSIKSKILLSSLKHPVVEMNREFGITLPFSQTPFKDRLL